MPGRVLPTFTAAEVESHNNADSCYVTIGSQVYDITSFVEDHPGGGDLILDYAGKDVKEILRDVGSHQHSESAYEILQDNLVGFLVSDSDAKSSKMQNGSSSGPVYATTGMSRAEDLSVDTDYTQDYKTHKFLDLNKPLLLQLWNSGFSKEFYLEQIHRPRHYKGGESAPLFGNFLEPLSKTAWYVVPIVWLPPISYGTYLGFAGLGNAPAAAAYWVGGVFLWSLIEYLMHRFLFHIDGYVPLLYPTYRSHLTTIQLAPGQSRWTLSPLPSSRHSPLPADGQVSTCDAPDSVRRVGGAVLEVGSYCFLLQLACGAAGILRRCLRLHLL